MNEVIRTQLNHRTIRKFKTTPVGPELLELILDVANKTASAMCLQHFSILRITDPGLKSKIADISGQAYIADMPELFVFLVDLYRNSLIAKEAGLDTYLNSMHSFLSASSDALLAAQNVNLAAESLGMGGVFLGSPLWKIEEFIEVLDLPMYTFPILAYGFGYPDEEPRMKPRMAGEFKFFENKYPALNGIKDNLKDYDREMGTYVDLRNPGKPLRPFTEQVAQLSTLLNSKQPRMMEALKKQGFCVEDRD